VSKSKRDVLIAGNWKMNKTPKEAKCLIQEILEPKNNFNCKVAICVPFVDLDVAIKNTAGTKLQVGAQNCHFEDSGAFTGEISARMLSEMGVSYVIIGHSERRLYFAETNETVNKRAKACISSGMHAIICVGETLDHRQKGVTSEIIRMQTKLALNKMSKDDMKKVIIAYEPIWAIGTGLAATSEQANEVCNTIRLVISELYDKETAENLIILYGGSMNANNASSLLSQPDIDGGLIGGASLKPVDFLKIIKEASNL
jgi:triosephosphate isomerase